MGELRPLNVLFVGFYREFGGWGDAAIDYLTALQRAEVNVVARPCIFTNDRNDIPEHILELENRDHLPYYDAVIQNTLPPLMHYDSRLGRNIGVIFTETDHLKSSCWDHYMNTMDEIWVANPDSKAACLATGVEVPIQVVPVPCDVRKFERSYDPLPLREQVRDDVIFYTIGEMYNRRKNLAGLVKAFHLEFDPDEPVQLLIKTNAKGSEEEAVQHFRQLMKEIKGGMKLYPVVESYKTEIIIAGELSNENIMRLHATCDCFVLPSYGEGWSLVGVDAMGMGKTPILLNEGGPAYFGGQGGCYLVDDFRSEPCFGMVNIFQELFTSRENWKVVSIDALRAKMREVYNNITQQSETHQAVKEAGQRRVYDFSYKRVGRRMRSRLEDIVHVIS